MHLLNIFNNIWNLVIYSTHKAKDNNVSLTVGDVLLFVFWVVLLYVIVFSIFRKVLRKIFRRFTSGQVNYRLVANVSSYLLFLAGLLVIMQSSGLNLSALSWFGGALGVGIGFGLQNITNNFISGVIIFFEKPIKRGDRVEVGDILGDVKRISFRSTSILTNDNISVIVPNSYFINNNVINWSHNDNRVRISIPVGVAYKEDPRKVEKLLLEIAGEDEDILKKPAPFVIFDELGDSSLNFTLMVFTSTYYNRPRILKSKLYFSIFEKFRQNNIEIPFPQRDLNLKDTWIKDWLQQNNNAKNNPQS
jgi:small-conductance mechanosensitive channel